MRTRVGLRPAVLLVACVLVLAACSRHESAPAIADPRLAAIRLCHAAASSFEAADCDLIEPALQRVQRAENAGRRAPSYEQSWYEQNASERRAQIYLCDVDRTIADCDNALVADAHWYAVHDAERDAKLAGCDQSYPAAAHRDSRDIFGCVAAVRGQATYLLKHRPLLAGQLESCRGVAGGSGHERCLGARMADGILRGSGS